MQAVLELYDEFIDLYSYAVEISGALHKWVEFVQNIMDSIEVMTPDSLFYVWRGDRDCSGELYNYVRTVKEIIDASEEGGRNIRLHRNAVVALAYSLWEDEYRQRIATECGLGSRNDVKSDVFQDLNMYRQAVLHVGGPIGQRPYGPSFFSEGRCRFLDKGTYLPTVPLPHRRTQSYR